MSANKPAMQRASDDGQMGSDLGRLDAHVVQPHEYDELPEVTNEMIARADLYDGPTLVRRGRPRSPNPMRQVTIRLDADVLDGLRATGAGWQGRVNAALRSWLAQRR